MTTHRDLALLHAEGLAKRFEREVWVLRDVSLTVGEGESVAITGPSGSGKTTLLHILAGLDRPDSGTVMLDGQDLVAATEAERARARRESIGIVFQDHHLLPQCSALDNTLLPALAGGAWRAPAAAVERARGLLVRPGLADRLDHRPAELSTGQRQRVAVARALVNRPRLLLADEPTGALDGSSSARLLELLAEVRERTALVLVTHSADVAARADRVLELRDGMLA